jgi:hypothetical protein
MSHRILRATVALAVVALLAPFAGTTNAWAKAKVTSVQFSGLPSAPVVVVTGSGFGAHAPKAFAPGPCPDRGSGNLFGEKFFFQDVTVGWTAGEGGKDGLGNCVGIVVQQWTKTSVTFSFGSDYGSGFPAWILHSGDSYSLTFKKTVATGTA